MNTNSNDPYANKQPAGSRRSGVRGPNQELSFENTSYDDEDMSMDASAFVNRHCNFAETSMIDSELAES